MGFGTDLMGEMIAAQSGEFNLRANVLSPMEIIKSATSINAEILEKQGELGCIAAGALADILVVDGDPSEDIDLLSEARNGIVSIMKNGEFVRNRIDRI